MLQKIIQIAEKKKNKKFEKILINTKKIVLISFYFQEYQILISKSAINPQNTFSIPKTLNSLTSIHLQIN